MKRLILVAFLSVLIFSVSAQTKNKNKKQADKASAQVSTSDQLRQLAIQLQLNEGQYIRFREVNKARAAQIDEMKSLYPNEPATQEAKINEIHKQYDAQLAQSLTPKQFTAFLQASGRPTVAPNTSQEATGYGGRALETTIIDSVAKPTNKINKDTLNNSSTPSNKNVYIKSNASKVNSEEEALEINARGEKVKNNDIIFKADAEETKVNAKDATSKAKREKGITKIETPDGKIEDGEVEIKLKGGEKVKVKE